MFHQSPQAIAVRSDEHSLTGEDGRDDHVISPPRQMISGYFACQHGPALGPTGNLAAQEHYVLVRSDERV